MPFLPFETELKGLNMSIGHEIFIRAADDVQNHDEVT